MSDCRAIESLLVDHALDELEPLKAAWVQAHLSRCETCSLAGQRLELALGSAKAWSAEVPELDLSRMNERLAPYLEPRLDARPLSRAWPIATGLAAGLAGLLLLATRAHAPWAPAPVVAEANVPPAPALHSQPNEPPPALVLEASTPPSRPPLEASAVARRRPAPGLKVVASADWDGQVHTQKDGNLELVMAEGYAVLDFDRSLGKKLFLRAPDVKVEVIGTRFYVEAVRGAPTTIGVISGKVELDLGSSRRALKAGEAVQVDHDAVSAFDPNTARSSALFQDPYLHQAPIQAARALTPPEPTEAPRGASIVPRLLEAEGLAKDGDADAARALYDQAVAEAPSDHQRALARLERARFMLRRGDSEAGRELDLLAHDAAGEVGRQAALLRCEHARSESICAARRCYQDLLNTAQGRGLSAEIGRALERPSLDASDCP